VKVLEQNMKSIRIEILEAMSNGSLLKEGVADTEGLTKQGIWTELNLFFQGRSYLRLCILYPHGAPMFLAI